MGEDPGRVSAASTSHNGTGEGQTKTEQSWKGKHRSRFEEAVGGKEGGDSETETRYRKEGRWQEDGEESSDEEDGKKGSRTDSDTDCVGQQQCHFQRPFRLAVTDWTCQLRT